FSLVREDGNLLERYDAQRGCRLTTFFAALARHELLKYWRSERRRRNREHVAVTRRPKVRSNGCDSIRMVWEEFVETLTQRERRFLEKVLLVPPSDSVEENLSQANVWQLRSRVLSKLKLYSANDSD